MARVGLSKNPHPLRVIHGLAAYLIGYTAVALNVSIAGEPSRFDVPVQDGRARVAIAAPDNAKVLVIVTPIAPGDQSSVLTLNARAAKHAESLPALGPLRAAGDAPVRRHRAQRPLAEPSDHLPPPLREFHVLARAGDPASPRNYDAVPARLRAIGKFVQIYVQEDCLDHVSDETLRNLVHGFDDDIHPRINGAFGPVHDVDADGRLTILMTSALAGLADAGGPVDGVMRGADFDTRVEPPFGNQCDLIVLNAKAKGSYLQSIALHEYVHAVIFSRRVLDRADGDAANEEESWLDEGLAHLVEDWCGYSRRNIDHRVLAFLAAPQDYRLVVPDYYGAKLFRSHGHRGAAYTFLKWCQARFGSSLLPALIDTDLSGIANVESATQTKFKDLFRAWTIDLFLNAMESPNGELPRFSVVEPDGVSDVWTGHPTAPHYTVINNAGADAIEIEVDGAPKTELQITVVRLPGDWPCPTLELDFTRPRAPLLARVRDQSGSPFDIDVVELLATALPESDSQGVIWRALAHPQPNGRVVSSNSAPRPIVRSDFQIELKALDLDRLPPGRLLLRARGRDRQGRAVAAWLEASRDAVVGRPPTGPQR